MAVGTPVVAVGEMGVAEVMAGNKGGLLVKHDLDEFTAAVFKMLDDKELYAAKKKEAFEYARPGLLKLWQRKCLGFTRGRLTDTKRKILAGINRITFIPFIRGKRYKMKIWLVSDTYFRINGVSVSMDNFAEEYRKLGARSVVLLPLIFRGTRTKTAT